MRIFASRLCAHSIKLNFTFGVKGPLQLSNVTLEFFVIENQASPAQVTKSNVTQLVTFLWSYTIL